MLSDEETIKYVAGPITKEAQVKYLIVMRLAERWALQAFRENLHPQEFCARRFETLSSCGDWSVVTKTILTAFVIREWAVIDQFLND